MHFGFSAAYLAVTMLPAFSRRSSPCLGSIPYSLPPPFYTPRECSGDFTIVTLYGFSALFRVFSGIPAIFGFPDVYWSAFTKSLPWIHNNIILHWSQYAICTNIFSIVYTFRLLLIYFMNYLPVFAIFLIDKRGKTLYNEFNKTERDKSWQNLKAAQTSAN